MANIDTVVYTFSVTIGKTIEGVNEAANGLHQYIRDGFEIKSHTSVPYTHKGQGIIVHTVILVRKL